MIELCQDIYLLVIINITPTTYMSASNSFIKKPNKFYLGRDLPFTVFLHFIFIASQSSPVLFSLANAWMLFCADFIILFSLAGESAFSTNSTP